MLGTAVALICLAWEPLASSTARLWHPTQVMGVAVPQAGVVVLKWQEILEQVL
jgi:hypothetical protein